MHNGRYFRIGLLLDEFKYKFKDDTFPVFSCIRHYFYNLDIVDIFPAVG